MYDTAMRRLDNIDLRLLRVFVALAEAGSFSGAQIELNLSQSTLSTHIASLERALGGRYACAAGAASASRHSVRPPCEQRETYLPILINFKRVGHSNDRLVGRLSIGIVDGVISNPKLGLQGSLQRTIAAAPDVYVDLRLGTPHELEQWVAEGTRDVVVGPFAKHGPGVVYVSLHQEAQALYCGQQHALFTKENLTVADIETSLFSVRGYRQLEDLYRVNHPRASAGVIHMEAQAMLILSGQFIGFLPRHMGDGYVERGMMRALKPRTYQFLSHHFAAYRRSDKDQPLIKLFLRELRIQAKDKTEA